MNASKTPSPLDRLLRFLGTDPRNPRLLADALRAARDEGDPLQAAALLAHLEQHGAPDATVAAHACLLHLQLGQPEAAARYGEQALAEGLDDPAIRYNTAFALLLTANHDRVEALTADPATAAPDLLVLRARALHYLERSEEAKTALTQALHQHPTHAAALGQLALLEQEDGRTERAIALAQQALQQDPHQLDALLALGDAYAGLDAVTDARAWYQAAATRHPDCGRAWSGLGGVAFSQLDFATAEQHLLEAVKHMPDHIGTWHLLAWIYILRNDAAKARAMLERSALIDRGFGDTQGGLAVVDVMEGRDDEARVRIRKAQRLAPEGMAARYAELLLLQKAGDNAGARALIEASMDQPLPGGGANRRALVERRLQELLAARSSAGPLH